LKPGDDLGFERVGQQVAGELLDGELVERLVLVVGADDPVAPRPHRARGVALEAVAVRVAREVEPLHRHLLPEVRRGQQAVQGLGPGVGRGVGEEGPLVFLRRRQAGEVERGAPQQRRAVGLRIGRETLLRQGRGDEPVDGVAARRDRGCGRLARQLEGPVALVLGAFGDPAAHRLDLRGREDLVELRRRHVVVGVRRQ